MFYARGKVTIGAGITDGSATTANWNYTPAAAVSNPTFYPYYFSTIAPTTTTNAQFYIKVKSTGTYTSSSHPTPIIGIDIDSFVVRKYPC